MSRRPGRSIKAPDLNEQTRESLDIEDILAFFAVSAQTQEGKAWITARTRLEKDDFDAYYDELEAWRDFLEGNGALRFPTIPNQEFFERDPNLKPYEKFEIRQVLDLCRFWTTITENQNLAFAVGAPPEDASFSDLYRRLGGLFDEDGDWRRDVTPTYAKLLDQFEDTCKRLDRTLNEMLRSRSEYLSEPIIFERNNRRVLAVNQDHKGRVRGILQDYSASGRTVFVEPQETVEMQNRIMLLVAELEAELLRLRRELSRQITACDTLLMAIQPRLRRMDGMQGLALTARDTLCSVVRPNFEKDLDIRNGRHPFLDQAFADRRRRAYEDEEKDENQMVPFFLALDNETRGMVISGANTGGKTVTLKTTGLLSWMANHGMPIPADEGSRIPYYRAIYADIGDHQSLSHNLSTYASHLVNMRAVLESIQGDTLILLDELGSGTDPQEGNALAQAIIEAVIASGDHLLVTTHQQILCTSALNHPNMINASMAFDSRLLKPTYRFQQGVPGRSHALEIATLAGLPTAVLNRAKELTADDLVDIQAAVRKLQEQHQQLQKQKAKVRKDELRLHRRISDARMEAQRLERLQEEYKRKEKEKLSKAVERAERELRSVIADSTQKKSTKKKLAEFAGTKRALLDSDLPKKLPDLPHEPSGLKMSQWQVGDKAFLKTWGLEGTIQGVDRKKVRLDCNGKVFNVDADDIIHLSGNDKQQPGKVKDQVQAYEGQSFSSELKLLGFRVEEALAEIETQIDVALRRNAPFLSIIHGHGSGALKTAVRDYLKTHPVKSMFSVEIDPKNDGKTDLKFQYD